MYWKEGKRLFQIKRGAYCIFYIYCFFAAILNTITIKQKQNYYPM